MRIKKILAHGIRMHKNAQTRAGTFWVFTDFHAVQSPACIPARKFLQDKRTTDISGLQLKIKNQIMTYT